MPHSLVPLNQRRRIGVIGGSRADKQSLDDAETLGRLIAENGFILVNGGMGGVMEASARAAHSAGGVVVGILPGKSTSEANRFVDIAIPTGIGYLRNGMVVLNSDIVVAIDGEYGTLSEIAYSRIYGRTVFGLKTWDIPGVIAVSSPEGAIERIISDFAHKL